MTQPTTQEMPTPAADDPELGECGRCRQTRELVATVHAVARHAETSEVLGTTQPIDLCGRCVAETMAEAMPQAHTVGVELEDGSEYALRRVPSDAEIAEERQHARRMLARHTVPSRPRA